MSHQEQALGGHLDLEPEAAAGGGALLASGPDNVSMSMLAPEEQLGMAAPFQLLPDGWHDFWSREPFPSGMTLSSITLIACVISTVVFLIVVGNLLVCIAIFTEKSLKPTQNWFIASLALSDMMLGLVVMPFSLARDLMGFWIFGPLWCDIHEALDVLLTTASINTLCLISLDRYWSITQAVSYLKKRTPQRAAFMIAFVWFLSAAVSLPPLFGWKKPQGTIKGKPGDEREYPSCELSDDIGYVLYSALGSFFIPCAVMVFTYIKIFLAARSRARRAISKQARNSAALANKRAAARRGPAHNEQPAPAPLSSNESAQQAQQAAMQQQANARQQILKGKIVIVDRRKSVALGSLEQTNQAAGEREPPTQQPPPDDQLNRATYTCSELLEAPVCSLTSSQARQAAPSALAPMPPPTELASSTATSGGESHDSSLITVMNASMSEVPVTRFQFSAKAPSEQKLEPSDRRAAALLETISQLRAESVGSPEIDDVRWLQDKSGLAALDKPASQLLSTTTNETCFMTIEEDGDLCEPQSGRTIMMVGGGPGAMCNSAACRRPSGSSCSQSDEELGESDELDDELDDELLTDDCNGYSVSCALDQYCPGAVACPHCQECELGSSPSGVGSHRRPSWAPDSPRKRLASVAAPGKPATGHAHHHHGHRGRRASDTHSLTADDNFSLTECRSQEDSSSIVGHDMLDATDSPRRPKNKERPSSARSFLPAASGQQNRKRSIIGFRLTRLGSQAPPSNIQGSNLMALASQQHQQQLGSQLSKHQSTDNPSSQLPPLPPSTYLPHTQQVALNAPSQQTTASNLKTLRQNFFMKLNQLTAKSSNKSDNIKAQKSSDTSPTGIQSSFEPSVDCATTSNVHSAEYQPEISTVAGNESDNQPEKEAQPMGILLKPQRGVGGIMGTSPSPGDIQGSRCPPPGGTPATDSGILLTENGPNAQLEANGTGGLAGAGTQQAAGVASKSADLGAHLHVPPTKPAGGPLGPNATTKSTATDPKPAGQTKMLVAGARLAKQVGGHGGSTGPAGSSNRAYLASDNERHRRKFAKARERRATLILGLIMACFICSWLPFFSFYVLRAICSACKELVSPTVGAVIFWMGYCNSAINPIIYTIFNRDFRKAFRKILFRCL